MSPILPLSADTIAQIHSSRNITSLQGVIFALLENSLDAGSNKVEIAVDFRRGGCTIEDNGTGILPSEFMDDGGLLKMYHTSKLAESETNALHGMTGTYLTSLSALSLLGIASRHFNSEHSASITAHQGKVISRQVPASEIEDVSLSALHGTRVAVRDLFGNMPVRVKQRTSTPEKSNLDAKAWSELRLGVVALLLAWPRPCSVRLRDAETGTKLLHVSSMHSTGNSDLTKRRLEQLAGKNLKFDVQDVLPILFQAGFAPGESRTEWIPVSGSTLNISVRGALCLVPSPTKQCQFISIGVHPCSDVAGGRDLYDVVNKLFNNSSFGALEDEEHIDDAEKDRRRHDRRFKRDGYTQKQTQSRKGVDRWPMFVLQVKLMNQKAQIEPGKMNESSLKAIVDVLEAMISQWLSTHHFRPRKIRQRKEKNSTLSSEASLPQPDSRFRDVKTPVYQQKDASAAATTSKKRKYVDMMGNVRRLEQHPPVSPMQPNDPFSTWSRIKSGRSSFFTDDFHSKKPATAPAERSGSMVGTRPMSTRPNFSLPTIDAGELNQKRPAVDQLTAQQGTCATLSTYFCLPDDDHVSSDDYGSFDDEAALAAADTEPQSTNGIANLKADDNLGIERAPSEKQAPDDAIMEWVDPKTKQVFNVNARTGVVLPSRPKSAVQSSCSEMLRETNVRSRAGIDTSTSSKGQPLSLARRPRSGRDKQGWLPGFLQEWSNPVFVQQVEEQIPATAISLAGVETTEESCGRHTHNAGMHDISADIAIGTNSLTKTSLKEARVIKQVDQKYILCRSSCDSESGLGETLILIDQHAASERVILEGLLAELCTPTETAAKLSRPKVTTTALDKPLRFQISEIEHRLFEDHVQHFADWGILYRLADKEELLGASQVQAAKREYTIIVEYLPPGIIERCMLVPRLLIDLLRSEVWTTEQSTKKCVPSAAAACEDKSGEEEHCWLRRIGSCPKGIIDMLNSRACRSAIMFNDDLSIAQCQELLSNLSQCAFPFMCAHGRVSMVPLIEPGLSFGDVDQSMVTAFDGSHVECFSRAFRAWKTKSIDDRDSVRSNS